MSVAAFADELEREKARQRTCDAMLRKSKAGAQSVDAGRGRHDSNGHVSDRARPRARVATAPEYLMGKVQILNRNLTATAMAIAPVDGLRALRHQVFR